MEARQPAIGLHVVYHGRDFVVTGHGKCHWCKSGTLVIRNTFDQLFVVHASEVTVVNSLLSEGSVERKS
ncbi:MAG: hypothetical protein A2V70_19430 [Planctomycetes bacterium RBG_13_63_9]|nr:MAG: hypothetical protein A2V70_19430 [Planctomycetes bacterium RBG_13_63_9]HXK37157.1 hypothetical protein [Candidatus Paceibacterota bacterium]